MTQVTYGTLTLFRAPIFISLNNDFRSTGSYQNTCFYVKSTFFIPGIFGFRQNARKPIKCKIFHVHVLLVVNVSGCAATTFQSTTLIFLSSTLIFLSSTFFFQKSPTLFTNMFYRVCGGRKPSLAEGQLVQVKNSYKISRILVQ